MSEFIRSKYFQWALFGIGSILVLAFVFALGVNVGARKVGHMNRFAEHYEDFAGPPPGPRGPGFGMMQGMVPDTHGAFGKVLSLSDGSFVVQSRDNLEKTVLVSSSTVIRRGRMTAVFTDIHPNGDVAVFGLPTQTGQIEARLIRIFSVPSSEMGPR